MKVLAGSFTGIQLPFWQCALAAKASAVLSWAALGKALPDAPGGDPSPWLSTAAARPGGVGSVLAPQYRRDVDVLEKVEPGATEMVEGMGQLCSEQRLRKLGQFSLQG